MTFVSNLRVTSSLKQIILFLVPLSCAQYLSYKKHSQQDSNPGVFTFLKKRFLLSRHKDFKFPTNWLIRSEARNKKTHKNVNSIQACNANSVAQTCFYGNNPQKSQINVTNFPANVNIFVNVKNSKSLNVGSNSNSSQVFSVNFSTTLSSRAERKSSSLGNCTNLLRYELVSARCDLECFCRTTRGDQATFLGRETDNLPQRIFVQKPTWTALRLNPGPRGDLSYLFCFI